MRIARYLIYTLKFGIFYKINLAKGLEVYVDTNFADSQSKDILLDPNSVLSRTGFVIMLLRYLLFWYSKI